MLKQVKDYILPIIAGLLILFILRIDLAPNLISSIEGKLLIYGIAMILIFVDMKIKNNKIENKIDKERNRKKGVTLIFIIYSILLVTLLLIDESYRRIGFGEQIKIFSKEHFEIYTNIIPFATILDFFTKYIEGNINLSIVMTNIIGNIIAFAPFGIFLPIIFKDKINNFKKFTIIIIIIVFLVECIQFVTKRGTFDIDDIILNTLGAVIFYGITKITIVQKMITKIIS